MAPECSRHHRRSRRLRRLPTRQTMAESSYAFAAKLLADQSRFMEALSKAMAPPDKKT